MAITRVSAGSATSVTTSAAVPYPGSLAANDLISMYLSSDSSSITTSQSGWTFQGSITTGGGVSQGVWTKLATGSETGNYTFSGITGGTKGVAWMTAFRGSVGTLSGSPVFGADTNSSNTTVSATGSSVTSVAGDYIDALVCLFAASGTFSGNNTSPVISQAGATVTSTARFAGRTGTNTIVYGGIDGAVTAGATGAPSYSATTVGANGTGQVIFQLIHETQTITGDATAAATAALSTTGAVEQVASVLILTTAGLAADGSVQQVASVTLGATAGLTADGSVTQVASAALATTAGLTADGGAQQVADATLATTAGLTADASAQQVAEATLAVTAALAAAGDVEAGGVEVEGAATMETAAALAVEAYITQMAAAILSATAGLVTSGLRERPGVAGLAATAGFGGIGALDVPGVASLETTATLLVAAIAGRSGTVMLQVSAGLAAQGFLLSEVVRVVNPQLELVNQPGALLVETLNGTLLLETT
jgi:hypothetical protein